MPVRDIKKRLKRALTDIDGIDMTQAAIVNIFSIRKGSREKACEIYRAMKKQYDQYLKEKNLINPGTDSIPNFIAVQYLELYGITKERLQADLKAQEERGEEDNP